MLYPSQRRRNEAAPKGSKNKPKAIAEPLAPEPTPAAPVRMKKTNVVAPPPPSESSEEEPEEPMSPATQRRAQWANYRQRQVDAHQQRVAYYTKARDEMLGF